MLHGREHEYGGGYGGFRGGASSSVGSGSGGGGDGSGGGGVGGGSGGMIMMMMNGSDGDGDDGNAGGVGGAGAGAGASSGGAVMFGRSRTDPPTPSSLGQEEFDDIPFPVETPAYLTAPTTSLNFLRHVSDPVRGRPFFSDMGGDDDE